VSGGARSQGLRWLEQAEDELDAAEKLRTLGKHYLVCFLCQQAAEKAFKAVLYAAGAASVRGHSVGELCREAARLVPALGSIEDKVAPLDAHYIPTRYPNSLPDSVPARVYRDDQSGDALVRARLVTSMVRAHFGSTEQGSGP
jgi:HEPN domain-containing protein